MKKLYKCQFFFLLYLCCSCYFRKPFIWSEYNFFMNHFPKSHKMWLHNIERSCPCCVHKNLHIIKTVQYDWLMPQTIWKVTLLITLFYITNYIVNTASQAWNMSIATLLCCHCTYSILSHCITTTSSYYNPISCPIWDIFIKRNFLKRSHCVVG